MQKLFSYRLLISALKNEAPWFAKTFRFSPFTFNLFLLFTTCCLSLAACSFNPPLQGKGEPVVQGEWRQDTSALQKKLLTYTLYNFRFSCDSFFVQIKTNSRVNNGADTCTQSGHWAEYAKGNYTLSHDTLQLKGLFCTPDYSLKKEGGCFRFGVYEENFKISRKTDSVYQFLSASSVTPFNVRLIKKITCIPKPL